MTYLYTVPPGGQVVLRDITVGNQTAAPASFTIGVLLASGLGSAYLATVDALPTLAGRHYELRQALEPGDRLWVNKGADVINLALTGFVFA